MSNKDVRTQTENIREKSTNFKRKLVKYLNNIILILKNQCKNNPNDRERIIYFNLYVASIRKGK